METCVRNSLYDKALDVAKFASTLHQRHKLYRYDKDVVGADGVGENEDDFVAGADGILLGIVRAPRQASGCSSAPARLTSWCCRTFLLRLQVRDVRKAMVTMRRQLLKELRGKLSLPSCLRVVGYLRTLYHHQSSFASPTHAHHTYDESAVTARLKREFLACRDAWHRGDLQALPVATPYNYVRALVVCVLWVVWLPR